MWMRPAVLFFICKLVGAGGDLPDLYLISKVLSTAEELEFYDWLRRTSSTAEALRRLNRGIPQ